jgi:hypothetical protein
MKTILLTALLLIGVNCFGQYRDTTIRIGQLLPTYIYVEDTLPDNELIEVTLSTERWSNDTIYEHKWIFEKAVILVMLKQYSEYETECHNDSTVETQHIISEHDPICYMTLMLPLEANYCTNRNHKCITAYKHKQPEFTDFMKWLKSKYK